MIKKTKQVHDKSGDTMQEQQSSISHSDSGDFVRPEGKRNILLIEDELQICGVVATVLEMEGYTVETAYDGEEGLEKLESFKPDLVICDRVMPGMSGEELLEEVRRARPQHDNLPFIFLSALSTSRHKNDVSHLNASAYLDKPANFSLLLSTIDDMFAKNR